LLIIGKWAVEGLLKDGLKGDLGLVLKSKAKHAAISAPMDRPFVFTNKPLIVQYDVTFQNGQECGNYSFELFLGNCIYLNSLLLPLLGGAYIKLLTQESGMR
jgi:hypothetical protein